MQEEKEKIFNIIQTNKIFDIKVIAGSSVDKIYLENDIIKVKVREIAENGKANKAIIDLFSKTFKIPKKSINIIRGIKSSSKTIQLLL